MFFTKVFGHSSARSDMDAISRSLAIIEFDPTGIILRANENFCKALGYAHSEIEGKHHSIFVLPEEARGGEYRAFWEKLRSGQFDAGEYRRIGKGGRDVWIQASYNPVLNASGEVVKVIKVAADITAEKMSALESKGLRTAFSRSQAMIEFKIDGTILTANENFLRAVGYELHEIQGRHHRMFVDPAYAQSSQYAEFWERLGSGEFFADEFKRVGKGGREIWIQASYNPIIDLDNKVVKVVKFATDVTERVLSVEAVGSGLGRLAQGDLTRKIDRPLIPALDKLRLDFNRALESMDVAMRQVHACGTTIDRSTGEIRNASEDLAKRCEKQVAALEETAAAIAEISTAVNESAKGAQMAGALVIRTRSNAEQSGEIVRGAVAAMRQIKQSSDEISNIIGIIDEIAFQTNLLALNAGVEAARAGEAGRGFAVVASEVRALAQRSAEAAKEIKGLITQSAYQVESGVSLVGETGQALERILAEMLGLDTNVSSIIKASQQQALALNEINAAIAAVDRTTQENAAMAEEGAAASSSLTEQVAALSELLGRFRLASASGHPDSRTRAERSAPSPSRAARASAPTAARGALALAQPVEAWDAL
jgi:methyl-accepting chemotaxis protein